MLPFLVRALRSDHPCPNNIVADQGRGEILTYV